MTEKIDHHFTFKRRVEFADTDMAGIMHFSNIFRYMEETEHAFYRSLEIPIHPPGAEDSIGWPRVHAECDYKYPARFAEILEIYLTVVEIKEKSICYGFKICKLEKGKIHEVAIGRIVVVCVSYDREEKKMKAIPIPQMVLERLASQINVAT